MDKIRLPIALVVAMAVQLSAAVWYASQQAATIANLEETVSQLGSRMAIEDNVNLKRDVLDNAMEIQWALDEVEDLWEEADKLSNTIGKMTQLQQRIALIENNLKYIDRDHNTVMRPMGK